LHLVQVTRLSHRVVSRKRPHYLSKYRITAPNGENAKVVMSSGPAVRIVAAEYGDNSTTSAQVTLTLARPLQHGTFYRIFIVCAHHNHPCVPC
jgi:hypothetical protein